MQNQNQNETESKHRLILNCGLAVVLGVAALPIAGILLKSITFFTQLFYFQRISLESASPWDHTLSWPVAVLIPTLGGLIVGFMAKYGSPAIRGHGIPEAMENILLKESRIPKRITWLKPLSAAIAIGSGGPFGAEGPIIATGGAFGSMIGQLLPVSIYERKILLSAGAAAGMTAIFGTPFAAVLLAIELMLFEFRSRSIIPVALAAATAATLRFQFYDSEPFLNIGTIVPASPSAIGFYLVLGVVFGFLSVFVTRTVYWIEDQFEHTRLHWMWWPAIGGLAVGLIGLIERRSLGVGYSNISDAINGNLPTALLLSILFWKFLSWAIALGSGTSGGTLAPLLTFGAAIGALAGGFMESHAPMMQVNAHLCAMLGMAALFAGCSHALLATIVFAFEITHQQMGIVPLLGACSMAHLVATLTMKNSIMTEKIARRGVIVPKDYIPHHHH